MEAIWMRGAVEKRGSGYSIRYEIGRDPVTGRRLQRRESGFATKKEAEAALAKRVTETNHGLHHGATRMTVGDWLKKWLDTNCEGRLSPSTVNGYRMIVELHLIPALGNLKLAKLTPLQIQDYYTEAQVSGRKDSKKSREGKLSPRTVAQHHRVLSRALKQAVRLGLIARNPCEMVDPPRYEKSAPETLTDKDVNKVLESVRGTYLYIPVLIALATGARRGEVLGLRWSDVDLEGSTITIRQNLLRVNREYVIKPPKTADSIRSVKLPGSIITELRSHQVKQKEWRLAVGPAWNDLDLVCTCEDGSPINPDSLSAYFRDVMKRAGFDGITFHGLRHSHATILLGWNVHPKKVSERLGHSSTKLTMDTYSHVTPTMQDEVANLLDEKLFSDKKKAK
jgi:integrase